MVAQACAAAGFRLAVRLEKLSTNRVRSSLYVGNPGLKGFWVMWCFCWVGHVIQATGNWVHSSFLVFIVPKVCCA